MEWLTARCNSPVAAILHRVARQTEDRSSFGHFSSSNFLPRDRGIFNYCPIRGLQRVCDARELIDNNDREIYQGTFYSGDMPDDLS